MKKFNGFYKGWDRCECGLKLKRTKGDNLVHLHGKYSQKSHDLVMRKKAEALIRAESMKAWKAKSDRVAKSLVFEDLLTGVVVRSEK
jgi:transcriptional antiterminator Rof (Rho-off)